MVSFACPVGVVALYIYVICGVYVYGTKIGFPFRKIPHPLENATKFADVKNIQLRKSKTPMNALCV